MIKAGILTISDSCFKRLRKDQSGPEILRLLKVSGIKTCSYEIIPDDLQGIRKAVKKMTDIEKLDIVFTTGGTGLGPRDNTPEAVRPLLKKILPGISEEIRRQGLKHTKRALLTRGLCGIRNKSLVVNLPGSPKAVRESLADVLEVLAHALDMLKGCGH